MPSRIRHMVGRHNETSIVYRNGTLLGAVPADVTDYADYTAVPETPYNYSIIPVRGNCPGLISPSVIGLKQGTPAAPSNCLASETECNDIIVTWTDNSDSEAGFKSSGMMLL
ncbi:MAG: hypothetical protein IPP40_11395 [bacterium]|nr:hypothetical protein [bacterium]